MPLQNHVNDQNLKKNNNNTKNWSGYTAGTSLHCCHCDKLAQIGKLLKVTSHLSY